MPEEQPKETQTTPSNWDRVLDGTVNAMRNAAPKLGGLLTIGYETAADKRRNELETLALESARMQHEHLKTSLPEERKQQQLRTQQMEMQERDYRANRLFSGAQDSVYSKLHSRALDRSKTTISELGLGDNNDKVLLGTSTGKGYVAFNAIINGLNSNDPDDYAAAIAEANRQGIQITTYDGKHYVTIDGIGSVEATPEAMRQWQDVIEDKLLNEAAAIQDRERNRQNIDGYVKNQMQDQLLVTGLGYAESQKVVGDFVAQYPPQDQREYWVAQGLHKILEDGKISQEEMMQYQGQLQFLAKSQKLTVDQLVSGEYKVNGMSLREFADQAYANNRIANDWNRRLDSIQASALEQQRQKLAYEAAKQGNELGGDNAEDTLNEYRKVNQQDFGTAYFELDDDEQNKLNILQRNFTQLSASLSIDEKQNDLAALQKVDDYWIRSVKKIGLSPSEFPSPVHSKIVELQNADDEKKKSPMIERRREMIRNNGGIEPVRPKRHGSFLLDLQDYEKTKKQADDFEEFNTLGGEIDKVNERIKNRK